MLEIQLPDRQTRLPRKWTDWQSCLQNNCESSQTLTSVIHSFGSLAFTSRELRSVSISDYMVSSSLTCGTARGRTLCGSNPTKLGSSRENTSGSCNPIKRTSVHLLRYLMFFMLDLNSCLHSLLAQKVIFDLCQAGDRTSPHRQSEYLIVVVTMTWHICSA